MPKQSPVPNDLDRPYWDACNEDRLVLQFCTVCDRYQYPPQKACADCVGADGLTWREISGRGTVYSYGVVFDTPIATLREDQPFTVAVIDLDEAPGINMISHLPGTAAGDVAIGAAVRLVFETTPATGQKVPEWRIEPAPHVLASAGTTA